MSLHAVKIACERPDTRGRSLSQWNCSQIAQELVRERVVSSISSETVRQMLACHRLKPWNKEMWLSARVPRDALFAQQVRTISDCYTRPLGPHECVLCCDEHTSMQPRPRLVATRASVPGHPTQVEHEYRRCGALNLLAAFDTRSGRVWGQVAPRKRQVEFIALLEQVDASLPEEVTRVVVILDNVPMHSGKQVQAWLLDHPRFAFVFLPVHCSWMNQIEQWFSILVRRRLGISDFASLSALSLCLHAFIAQWNECSHGFAWTSKSFQKVLSKCEQALEGVEGEVSLLARAA